MVSARRGGTLLQGEALRTSAMLLYGLRPSIVRFGILRNPRYCEIESGCNARINRDTLELS